MTTTKWELQSAAVNRMRAVYEAHYALGVPAQEQFSAAKSRVIHALQRELDAAREVTFNRFTAGYKP